MCPEQGEYWRPMWEGEATVSSRNGIISRSMTLVICFSLESSVALNVFLSQTFTPFYRSNGVTSLLFSPSRELPAPVASLSALGFHCCFSLFLFFPLSNSLRHSPLSLFLSLIRSPSLTPSLVFLY